MEDYSFLLYFLGLFIFFMLERLLKKRPEKTVQKREVRVEKKEESSKSRGVEKMPLKEDVAPPLPIPAPSLKPKGKKELFLFSEIFGRPRAEKGLFEDR